MKLPGLKKAREAARISQTDLATKAKVTAQTVSNIERGKSASWKTMNKLARALGVAPGLLEREGAEA